MLLCMKTIVALKVSLLSKSLKPNFKNKNVLIVEISFDPKIVVSIERILYIMVSLWKI